MTQQPGGTVQSWIDEWYTAMYPFGIRLTIDQRSALAKWIEQHQRGDDNGALREALREANDVLRSTFAIAEREGRDTEWPSFMRRVEAVLKAQHALMYPNLDEQSSRFGEGEQ